MQRLSPAAVIGTTLVASMFCFSACQVRNDSTMHDPADPVESESSAQTPTNSLPVELDQSESCDKGMAEVRNLISASKSCVVDSDCALFSPGCPFGCVDAVRADQISKMKLAYRDYTRKCDGCVYMCPQPAFERMAACEQAKCVVRENTAKDLEEKALQHSLAPEN